MPPSSASNPSSREVFSREQRQERERNVKAGAEEIMKSLGFAATPIAANASNSQNANTSVESSTSGRSRVGIGGVPPTLPSLEEVVGGNNNNERRRTVGSGNRSGGVRPTYSRNNTLDQGPKTAFPTGDDERDAGTSAAGATEEEEEEEAALLASDNSPASFQNLKTLLSSKTYTIRSLRAQVSNLSSEKMKLEVRVRDLERDKKGLLEEKERNGRGGALGLVGTAKGRPSVAPGAAGGERVLAAREYEELERQFATQEKLLEGYQKENEKCMMELEQNRRTQRRYAEALRKLYGEDFESSITNPSFNPLTIPLSHNNPNTSVSNLSIGGGNLLGSPVVGHGQGNNTNTNNGNGSLVGKNGGHKARASLGGLLNFGMGMNGPGGGIASPNASAGNTSFLPPSSGGGDNSNAVDLQRHSQIFVGPNKALGHALRRKATAAASGTENSAILEEERSREVEEPESYNNPGGDLEGGQESPTRRKMTRPTTLGNTSSPSPPIPEAAADTTTAAAFQTHLAAALRDQPPFDPIFLLNHIENIHLLLKGMERRLIEREGELEEVERRAREEKSKVGMLTERLERVGKGGGGGRESGSGNEDGAAKGGRKIETGAPALKSGTVGKKK